VWLIVFVAISQSNIYATVVGVITCFLIAKIDCKNLILRALMVNKYPYN
jgi:hypothetical protein